MEVHSRLTARTHTTRLICIASIVRVDGEDGFSSLFLSFFRAWARARRGIRRSPGLESRFCRPVVSFPSPAFRPSVRAARPPAPLSFSLFAHSANTKARKKGRYCIVIVQKGTKKKRLGGACLPRADGWPQHRHTLSFLGRLPVGLGSWHLAK